MSSLPAIQPSVSVGPSLPRDIPRRPSGQIAITVPSHLSISAKSPVGGLTQSQGDRFSPHTASVNQNGSFDFDRVIKSGTVQKRTRKTKTWKGVYLVLRPNLLSIYKNEQEVRLRQQVNLADLTAVAYLKDPKREHVFGLFTPSKNYHLEASSDKEALEWVELIRQQARIEEAEAEMRASSLEGPYGLSQEFGRRKAAAHYQDMTQVERLGSSSPEPAYHYGQSLTTRDGIRIPPVEPRLSNNFEHSGNEIGSYSDFSDDVGSPGFRDWPLSLSPSDSRVVHETKKQGQPAAASQMEAVGDASAIYQATRVDSGEENERVIWHGYLYCLKSKGGVRQWKKLWAVLRPKKLALYKNDEEYSAILLIPISSIINAVEIDPISRSKAHCMQIIAEDKSFRFCASDEETLAKWLGALKSQLARKKEAERKWMEAPHPASFR